MYWKPIYHVWVETLEVVIANARSGRQRPGRKMDKADAAWLAELLAHGLVVALNPIGAYEVWIATLLVARLHAFVREHQLGRAVQEMLFDLTSAIRRKRRLV